MASQPYFDKDKGRWRMKWWAGLERGWVAVTLCPHPGAWTKDRPPKRPPPEAQLLASKYRDMETQARHGVSVAPVRGHDLKSHLAAYRERFAREKAAGSVPALDRAVRNLLDHCSRHRVKTLEAVNAKVVRDFLHWRFETVTHATIKVEKGLLSKVWTDARLDGLVAENPWLAVRVPGTPKSEPPPYWTKAELDKLAGGCKGWLRDLILVGANTGLRITALLGLEWRDVSFERNVLTVRSSLDKAKRGYQVPLSPTANEVLARRWLAHEPGATLVFAGPKLGRRVRINIPYKRIGLLVKRLGLPDKKHYNHILRHTFATHAVAAGVPLHTVSAWLGHSSIKMTERYAHVIPSESHRQMEKFDLSPPPAP